jgi:hypothetical protein
MGEALKVIAFFDYMGYEEDKEDLKSIVYNFELEYPEKKISLYVTDNESDFASHLSSGCLAIIDYGALNFSGQSGLKDSYDRFMLNIIENNPTITFCFKLTMGNEWYQDDLFQYENVTIIDTSVDIEEWNELFLKYY